MYMYVYVDAQLSLTVVVDRRRYGCPPRTEPSHFRPAATTHNRT